MVGGISHEVNASRAFTRQAFNHGLEGKAGFLGTMRLATSQARIESSIRWWRNLATAWTKATTSG